LFIISTIVFICYCCSVVKNAQMAQSAVVVFGGATMDTAKGRGSLQDIDQFALMKPHCKWMCHVSKVAEIVPMVEKAFAIAREGTPGPVFVEIPLDTLYPPNDARDL
jgi:thiamine pyrophosphate-dependent acetolactate synthase large subunit-like protein